MALSRILLILGAIFSIAMTNFALAEPGFFPVDEAPAPVKKAADSIFEIYFLNVASKKTFHLFTELGDLRAKIEAAHVRPQIKKIFEFQIQYCLINKIWDDCDIYFDTAQATGFLVGDRQTLWTNHHAVEDFIESLAQVSHHSKWVTNFSIERQNLPLFVFDQKGNLVFSATKARGRATLTVQPFAADPKLTFFPDSHNQSSDFISIKLSSPIGQPIQVAKADAKVGDSVFMLGYPIGTGKFIEENVDAKHAAELVSRAPAPDSDGQGLKLMKGRLIPIEDLVQVEKYRDTVWWQARSSMRVFERELNYFQLIASDCDTVFGASGSAMVNLDGELIGMNAGGETIAENGKVVRVVQRGIRLPEVLRKLEEKR
jgi:hypothetical protein